MAEPNSTSLDHLFSELRRAPRLSPGEERRLASAGGRGCRRSVDRLVVANLAFVARLARRYSNMGVPYEDLLHEGSLGLLEAARRFDTTRENRFLTYAVWWIRRSILAALSDHATTVRAPSGAIEQNRQRRLGGESPPAKLVTMVSLDQPPNEGAGRSFAERLSEEPSAEQAVLREEAITQVETALEELSERERSIVERRFGLGGQPSQTLRSIADEMGVSRERVRQLEEVAKGRLRRVLQRLRPRQASPGAPYRA